MPTPSTEGILAGTARGILMRVDETPHGTSVRTQAAVVRSLVHELESHPASDGVVLFVREQVKEELLRLMRLTWGESANSVAADHGFGSTTGDT
jgi:hypothetical protein